MKARLCPSTYNSYAQHVGCHILPRIGSVKLQTRSGFLVNALYATLAEHACKDAGGGRVGDFGSTAVTGSGIGFMLSQTPAGPALSPPDARARNSAASTCRSRR